MSKLRHLCLTIKNSSLNIERVRKNVQSQTHTFSLAELEIRQRKFRLETEVDGLIAKYDDFMITQQDEIENVQEAYDIEKEQLDELQARFDKLKVRKFVWQSLTSLTQNDYDKIIEERRLAAEEEERKRKEFEMKVSDKTSWWI